MRKRCSNVYEGSDIQRYLKGKFRETVPQGLLDMAEGDFFLLSKEEVEKYIPREVDRAVSDENGETLWWWTRSADRSYENSVYFVATNGGVAAGSAWDAVHCAPAVYISA